MRTNVCIEGTLLKSKGFTLIELLAVIVILAIIAVIAIPIVLNIIKDTKVSSIKRSSELYIDAVELTLAKAKMDNIDITQCKVEKENLVCNDKKYKIEINGNHPEEVEIQATKNGEIYAAIKTEGYCIIRMEDEESFSYKKIVDKIKDTETEITNNKCTLNPYTSEKCFGFNSETGTITKYYSYENNDTTQPTCPKDVVIPKKINDVEVIILGIESFHGKGLTSVEIPNTVTTINRHAFYGNNLKELTIPEGVTTIDKNAFNTCKIEKLSLPSTLTSIGTSAFANNKLKQEDAYIYKRNSDGTIDYTTIIGYGGELTDIVIPSEKNGVKLTTIGGSGLQGCRLTSVEIPSTVTTIKSHAFYNNPLTELIIPEGVITIEGNAFNTCKIEKLSLPSTLTSIGTSAFANNKLKQEDAYIYKRNSDGTIDYTTIIGYGGELTDIVIPSEKNGVKLTTIGGSGMQGCGLTSVEIPSTVTTIKKYAFLNNPLTQLIISEGVTTIEDNAFYNCKIEALSLPSTITSIGKNAFYNNPLTTVTIANKQENVTIRSDAFGSFDTNNIVWEPIEE